MEPGLDLASTLEPGRGWIAANVQVQSDAPLAIAVEAGVRFNPNLVGYGDIWVQPTQARAGADVGLRYKERLDIFAGGWGDRYGNYAAQAGARWRF